jgi:hypothetical protein
LPQFVPFPPVKGLEKRYGNTAFDDSNTSNPAFTSEMARYGTENVAILPHFH